MSNKILATVGNLTVTEADVNEYIAALGQRGAGYNTPDGRRAVLSQLALGYTKGKHGIREVMSCCILEK